MTEHSGPPQGDATELIQAGRGKAEVDDQYVFVVMEGGLTPHEEILIADGKEEEVRRYRLSFEESMRDTATRAVAEIVDREVLDYRSQIVFYPPRTLEWFVLAADEK